MGEPNTSKRAVLARIKRVRAIVADEIAANAKSGGIYAAGLSSEGRAGGYLAALDDVAAALTHGFPSDHSGYWRRAAAKEGETQ
jgi:hypothetical protein